MINQQIFIGSDHGGFEMKEIIKQYLNDTRKYVTIIDVGTYSNNSCDYPDIAQKLCKQLLVSINNNKLPSLPPLGILICGTGIGISIAANKIKEIRCALCHNEFTTTMARQHNNANVLAIGARTTDIKMALKIVDIFLTEKFEGGRHQRRINKIK